MIDLPEQIRDGQADMEDLRDLAEEMGFKREVADYFINSFIAQPGKEFDGELDGKMVQLDSQPAQAIRDNQATMMRSLPPNDKEDLMVRKVLEQVREE